ncbi:MAG: HAD family hydrolase [Rhodospirillales bacterium]|jgi:2-haloalkanoic acid dehalogenase type II|nr:HAD family hydrolase [Rhodospirillales bacterium]
MRLDEIEVLSFDCFGTLIDWETGIWAALQPLLARATGRGIGREPALAAFARLETAAEHATPAPLYADVLATVHAGLAQEWNIPPDPAADRAFAAAIADWPAFPDTASALRALAARHKLVILSNVDRAGFAVTAPKLGVTFDAVLTAQDIGSYKPDPRNFAALLARVAGFGVSRAGLLHVAQSLFHDHAPANTAGIASAWIDRRAGTAGGATAAPPPGVHYDLRCTSLGELAARFGSAGGQT